MSHFVSFVFGERKVSSVPGQHSAAPAQIALVDALTWDYQTVDELADQVWSWVARDEKGRHPSRDHIRPLVKLLRRRGIAIENLLGFGYRFVEDQ